ncbi:MAG: hypothetical protein ACP5G0_04655 [Desulfomonilia bacterium]
MVVTLEMKVRIFFLILSALLLFVILPMRAETADFQLSLHDGKNLPMHEGVVAVPQASSLGLFHLSCIGIEKERSEIGIIGPIEIRSHTPISPGKELPIEFYRAEESTSEFKESILPLFEVVCSLSKRIALGMRGHLNRYCPDINLIPDAGTNEIFGYSLFLGPSFFAGPGDRKDQIYTQVGLGYKVLNDDLDIPAGDCPTSIGTGFSIGYKVNCSDMRLGYSRFGAFSRSSLSSDDSMVLSSVFFHLTYFFNSY